MGFEDKHKNEADETKGLSRRSFVKGAVLGAAGLALGSGEFMSNAYAAQKPVELVFHEIHDHNVAISDLWMKEVERRCQGQVHFTKYVGKELPAGLEVDVFRDVPAKGGTYLLMDLIQMPFVTRKSADASRTIAQLYEEFEAFRKETMDYKVCGLGTGSLMGVFTGKKVGPIKNPNDLKGTRIRSILPIDACLAEIGAAPIHVNYLELKDDMISGKIDAAVLGLLPAQMFNLVEEVAPYCMLAVDRNISTHPMRVAMKWESWNKLPADAQKAIDELGPAGGNCWFAKHIGPDFDKSLEDGALKYVREKGHVGTWDLADLDEWIRRMQPGVDARIKLAEDRGLPGRKFYERILQLSEIV